MHPIHSQVLSHRRFFPPAAPRSRIFGPFAFACAFGLASSGLYAANPVTLSRTSGTAAQANFLDGTVAWTNPANATGATNSGYATVALSTNAPSRKLSLTNFGFTIPTDATILSVRPVVRLRRTNTASCLDYVARLTSSLGASPSWPDVANWPTTATSRTYNGGTPLWNLALTPAVVNATSFGFETAVGRYQFANTASAEIDSVQLDVRYVRWAAGEVGGIAFRDFDSDGVRDFGETPLQGITITAYNSAGTSLGSTATDADGAWTLAVADGQAARIEATGQAADHSDAPIGTSTASLVRFITAPAGNVNFGFTKPGGDTAGEPFLATPCYVGGDHATGPNANGHVLVMAPYDANSEVSATGILSTPGPTSLADAIHIGGTYGLAYQHASKSVFAGAFTKRKVDYGPSGPGAIYRIGPGVDGNLGTADDTRNLFLDLNALFSGAAGTDHHATNATNLLNDDVVVVPYVGKEGLGDMDLSADGTKLYVMALGNKTLYEIPIGNPPTVPAVGDIRAYPLPAGIVAGIPDGDVRPFGIGIKGSRVFVGGVTTAESTVTNHTDPASGDETKLNAVVWEIALQNTGGTHTNKYTQALTFSLQTARSGTAWTVWSNYDAGNGHPEALLSDIEFDGDDMVLGFRDRYGDKTPAANKGPLDDPWPSSRGDILRAAWNGSAFVLESNGTAGSLIGSGVGNTQGPGNGEYYAGEDPSDGSNEGAQGALAFHKGRREVASIVYDPINPFINETFFSNGWTQFNLNGSERNSYAVFDLGMTSTFGKAAGLGDLELVFAPPGIEVGNRVWLDNNGNGIQDANEPGLAGVTVTLKAPGGAVITTAVTNSTGNYSFSSATGTNTASAKYGLTQLTAGTAGYSLSIASADAALLSRRLTRTNADGTANGDQRDSDATLSGSDAVVSFAIAASGGNDHSFDFGFAEVGLGNVVFVDGDADGHYDTGEGVDGVLVELWSPGPNGAIGGGDDLQVDDPNQAGAQNYVVTTANGGCYLFSGLLPASYYVKIPASEFAYGEPLHGLLSVPGVGLGDDSASEDGVDDAAPTTNGIRSGLVSLIAGAQPTDATGETGKDKASDNLRDADTNLTVDFGLADCLGPHFVNQQFDSTTITQSGQAEVGDSPAQAVTGTPPALGGWFVDNGYLVDTTGAGTRRNVVWIGNTSNSCLEQLLAGLNSVPNPCRIRICFDVASAKPLLKTSTGTIVNGSLSHQAVLNVQFWDGSVFGASPIPTTGFLTAYPVGGVLTGNAMQLTLPASSAAKDIAGAAYVPTSQTSRLDWDTLAWQRVCLEFDPDPDGDGNMYFDFSQTSGADNLVFDNFSICAIPCVGLGNVVFRDVNGNGRYDTGAGSADAPLANVTIQLFAQGANPLVATPLATKITDAQGRYLFETATPGNYFVFLPPSQFSSTGPLHGLISSYGADTGQTTDDNLNENGQDVAQPATSGVRSNDISLIGNNQPAGEAGVVSAQFEDDDVNLTVDFGFMPSAHLGNLVWLDEDSDGRQDAGERGLANVRVLLLDSSGVTQLDATWTDAQGRYGFDVPPGSYRVAVDPTTLPAGYSQTSTYPVPGTQDFTNKDQTGGYFMTVGPSGENLTGDFGYNANPTGDVTGGTNTGAIGDRVWVDADADGQQDAEEIGLPNVSVQLCAPGADGLFGTGDDPAPVVTMTDATGYYLFDGLAPGAYAVKVDSLTLPAGYVQTGDPDHYATAAGANDHLTTTPLVLAPGDVFLLADFGYQPPLPAYNLVGNFVWLDADADGNQDLSELTPALAGVTVALIRDTNGDGDWDSGEPIIASTETQSNGIYQFSGLPDGRYLVWVNDTKNVLDGLRPTYDSNGTSTPNTSAVDLDSASTSSVPVSDDAQDFGYTPQGHAAGLGLLGNYVWLDQNRDGLQDTFERGLEGVKVVLQDASGSTLLGVTHTNEVGLYVFGGLDPLGSYKVLIDPTNFLPGGPLEGMANTWDADGGADNMSAADLGAAGGDGNNDPDSTDDGINAGQDFGYAAPPGNEGFIGDILWLDRNADGDRDALSEPGLDGVTIDLYRDLDGDCLLDPGEPLVGSWLTGGGGLYGFSALPFGKYLVDVTDTYGRLAGYWHSLGLPDTNNHSQADPYCAEITALVPSVSHADFGYHVDPAAVGNYVFLDRDNNGLQSTGDTPLAGVIVSLTITYPNAHISLLKTTADSAGFYSFGNLLLDEHHRTGDGPTTDPNAPAIADAPTQPQFVLRVDLAQSTIADAALQPTALNQGASDKLDADDSAGVLANPIKGTLNVAAQSPASNEDAIASYDFGFKGTLLVSGQVRFDSDQDGSLSDPDTPLEGYTIRLYRDLGVLGTYEPGTDVLLETLLTLADGSYSFDCLPNGRYLVTETPPNAAVRQTGDASGPADRTIPILLADEDSTENDFLETVDPQGWFYDVENCQVVPGGLVTASGPGAVTYVKTGADGEYAWLTDGSPGTYTMTISVPPGYTLAPQAAYQPQPGDFDAPPGPGTVFLGSDVDSGGGTELIDCLAATNPWYTSFILASGDSAVRHNNIPLLRIKPRTFAGWQARNPLGGENEPTQNADGDSWKNLLEYALCLTPDSGVPNHAGFCVAVNTSGPTPTLEAVFFRAAGALADVTYCLQARDSLPTLPAGTWQDIMVTGPDDSPPPGTTVTNLGNGLEEVRVANLGALAPLTNASGFVRLTVKLASPSVMASTQVQGWKLTTFEQNECATFADPFLEKEAFSGEIASVSGNQITIAELASTDLATVLDLANKSYYLEVVEGTHPGHRYDITGAGHGTVTLANDNNLCAGPPYNTLMGVPSTLADDRFIVRQHHTLAGLFPPSAFEPSNTPTDADRILVFTGTVWKVYYVQSGSPAKWVDSADNTLADMGDTVLPPGQGYFVHPDNARAPALPLPLPGPIDFLAMGIVRENAFCLPLNGGYTLVAGGFPKDQTAAERALITPNMEGSLDPALSDQIHLWNGDAPTYTETYECYFRLQGFAPIISDRWSNVADATLTDVDAAPPPLFRQDRSSFLFRRSALCLETYCMPLPWMP